MRSVLLPLSAAMLLMSCQTVDKPVAVGGPAARPCDSSAERDGVARTIHAFFAALAKDDHAALRRLTTPSFYAFEVGKRYSGPELAALLAEAHKAGRVINWNIGPISARVDCTIASAAWENIGSAGTAREAPAGILAGICRAGSPGRPMAPRLLALHPERPAKVAAGARTEEREECEESPCAR